MAGTRGSTSTLKNKQDKGEFNPINDIMFGLVNALFPTGGDGGESSQAMTLAGAGDKLALAKGNKGEALPGSQAMEKGPNLDYIFGEGFGDRPAFTTVPPAPTPMPAPVGRMSDANPITQPPIPTQAPGYVPPMPVPKEAAGPIMPENPIELLTQALQPIQQPQEQAQEQPLDKNRQFQDFMRQALLSGVR